MKVVRDTTRRRFGRLRRRAARIVGVDIELAACIGEEFVVVSRIERVGRHETEIRFAVAGHGRWRCTHYELTEPFVDTIGVVYTRWIIAAVARIID